MKTIDKIIFSIIIVALISFMVTMLSLKARQDKERIIERYDKYEECKERTGDVEWCFNEFRPKLTF